MSSRGSLVMVRGVTTRNRSVSVDFTQAQDAVGSMKEMPRSMSRFRLNNFYNPLKRQASDEQSDRLSTSTILSFKSEPLRLTKVESKDRELKGIADPEVGKLARWWDDLRHRGSKKSMDLSTAGQKKALQHEESAYVGVKKSIWSRLLAKLRSHAPKIRPSRSERTTPQQQQRAYPLPRPNSIRIIRTMEEMDLRKDSSLHVQTLQSQRYPVPAIPLWQRRKVCQPAPLNSREIRMNRSRRR